MAIPGGTAASDFRDSWPSVHDRGRLNASYPPIHADLIWKVSSSDTPVSPHVVAACVTRSPLHCTHSIPPSFTEHSHPADSIFKLIPWQFLPIVVPHERSPSDRFRKWFNYKNHTHISVDNSFNDLATCTNDTGCCSPPSAGRLNKGHPEKASVVLALLALTRFKRACDTYGACMRPHKGKGMNVKG